jgi:hypothetical protein
MILAEAVEAIESPLGHRDVYSDTPLFSFLVNGTLPDDLPEAKRRRVQNRAKLYAWDGQSLWRILPDGARRMCPAPALRPALVQQSRVAPRVTVTDSPPYYSCNLRGQPMQAVPTLIATQGSWRHRDGGPGMVWDPYLQGRTLGAWAELNPDERERAMGYGTGITNATGVTLAQRHTLMGNALDANAVSGLFALSWALSARQCTPTHPPPCSFRVRLGGGSGAVSIYTRVYVWHL